MPRCACACGSASDCSTTSVVSPPPTPVRSCHERGRFPWANGGTARTRDRSGDEARGTLGLGETGLRARNSDPGRSTESRAGLDGMKKGRGRAVGKPRSVEMGSRLHPTVSGSARLDLGPFALHPQPESFACLHAFLRSRGIALLYPAIRAH